MTPNLSLDQVALQIMTAIGSFDEQHNGDVVASFIHYIEKNAPKLFNSLLKIDGFAHAMYVTIKNEKKQPMWGFEAVKLLGDYKPENIKGWSDKNRTYKKDRG